MKRIRLLNILQIVIASILFFFLLILTIYKPFNQDEGVFLTIGKFLHYGILPYLDIFDHKTPGIYFFNFLLFGLSNNLIFIKIVYLAINLGSVILITKIYISISNQPRYIYLTAILFLILLMVFEGNYLIAEVPMIFCFLFALNIIIKLNTNHAVIAKVPREAIYDRLPQPINRLRNDSKQSYVNYFVIGFFCSLAIVFKQTAIVSSLIIIFYSIFKIKNDIPRNKVILLASDSVIPTSPLVIPASPLVIPAKAGIQNKKSLFLLISGFLLPLFLVLVYLFSTQTLNEGVDQIIWRNVCCYPKESFFSIINYLYFYFWHILPIWILAIIGIFFSITDYQNSKRIFPIILLVILPVPFFFIRHYPHYWIQIIPFLAILASFGLERLLTQCHCRPISEHGIKSRVNLRITALVFAIFASIALMLLFNLRWFSWQFTHNYVPKWQEQNQVVKYLKDNNLNQIVAESQFSYFSFYNSEKPPSKYLYITEINNQNNQAEKETIEILKENKNIAVLWPQNLDFAYAKNLQQYILENYQPKKVFENIELVIYTRY